VFQASTVRFWHSTGRTADRLDFLPYGTSPAVLSFTAFRLCSRAQTRFIAGLLTVHKPRTVYLSFPTVLIHRH